MDQVPEHKAAREYIDYVEQNRGALEERFRALFPGREVESPQIEGFEPTSVAESQASSEDFSFSEPTPARFIGEQLPSEIPHSDTLAEKAIRIPEPESALGAVFDLPPEEETRRTLGRPTIAPLVSHGSNASSEFSADEATPIIDAEQIEQMLGSAEQMMLEQNFDGAFWLGKRILAAQPGHPRVPELMRKCRAALLTEYETRIGELERVPKVLLQANEIVWRSLDHRAGFLLSQIDSHLSYAELLDISGMDRFETLSILVRFLEEGVIASTG